MRRLVLASIVLLGLQGCNAEQASAPEELPRWAVGKGSFFPADRTLTHAEDGVVLADGTLVVGDFKYGLVTLAPDGTRKPFGDFAKVGFEYAPSPNRGGPNGISFEPDGRHVLVADIFTGAIYRADTVTQAVTKIYDHPYGVNAAVRDSSGAIWFTQSTENPPGAKSEERMFAAVTKSLSDGAVFRIAPGEVDKPNPVAELKLSGLDFANGIVIDEKRGEIFVNELLANRILGFRVDVKAGTLSDRRVVADVTTPDNIELDEDGRLWVASPIGNEIMIVDPESGETWSAFAPTRKASAELAVEWRRRIVAGEDPADLLGPGMFGPMPGILTGVILTPNGGPVYFSGLGNALVKVER